MASYPAGKTTAIVPAGGIGRRMTSAVPKQLLEIGGKPILIRTLRVLDRCTAVDEILVVAPTDFMEKTRQILDCWKLPKVTQVIPGGRERQDSVRNALRHLSADTEIVLVHDAVRPFVSVQKVNESIEAARRYGAAILAVPSNNTIKQVREGWVERTLDRKILWQVQTPQVFWKTWIVEAYAKAENETDCSTDDSMLVERIGHKVRVVEGEYRNIKITCREDWMLAEAIAAEEDR